MSKIIEYIFTEKEIQEILNLEEFLLEIVDNRNSAFVALDMASLKIVIIEKATNCSMKKIIISEIQYPSWIPFSNLTEKQYKKNILLICRLDKLCDIRECIKKEEIKKLSDLPILIKAMNAKKKQISLEIKELQKELIRIQEAMEE